MLGSGWVVVGWVGTMCSAAMPGAFGGHGAVLWPWAGVPGAPWGKLFGRQLRHTLELGSALAVRVVLVLVGLGRRGADRRLCVVVVSAAHGGLFGGWLGREPRS